MTNRGTKGSLDDWTTPGIRHFDLYLILRVAVSRLYAKENQQEPARKIGKEGYHRDAESCHTILVKAPWTDSILVTAC